MSGVLDLEYGQAHHGVDALFEHIDEPGLDIPLALPAWSGQVTHPSTWGTRRISEFRRRLAAVGVDAIPVPRAVALARSHADATVRRCAVIETAVAPSTGGHWMAHLVERRDGAERDRTELDGMDGQDRADGQDGDWAITRVAVTLPADVPDDPAWAEVVAAADVAVVDGPESSSIDEAMRTIAAPPGGAVRAARELVARHGGLPVSARALLASAVPRPPEPLPRPKRPIVV
ncbi:MAG: hypothetical protein ACTIMF_03760, partial [Gordonia sp. (in: high G+C Gram-positive bacteria)]